MNNRRPQQCTLALAAMAVITSLTGCATAPPESELRAGPSVVVPSDGRLGGAYWNHPKGAKLPPL
jgi:hypothetical protein